MRSANDVIYADELGDEAALTFTRDPPTGGRPHVAPERIRTERFGPTG